MFQLKLLYIFWSINSLVNIWLTESSVGGAVGVVKQEAKHKAPTRETDGSTTGKKKRKWRKFGKKQKGKTWIGRDDVQKQDICGCNEWGILGLQHGQCHLMDNLYTINSVAIWWPNLWWHHNCFYSQNYSVKSNVHIRTSTEFPK